MLAPKAPGPELLFFWLFASHYIADFPLQGTFLATAKSRHSELGRSIWPHALFAHAMIHGSGVAFVTGSVTLGIAEVVVHAITDFCKCEGWIDFNIDQAIHLACKLLWGYIALHAVLS